MTRARRSILAAALVACTLSCCAIAVARVNGVVLDRAVAVGAFTLADHDGKPFTAEQLKGRWTLILAGFTHCPDVCPFTLANLEQVVAELGLRLRPDRLPAVVFLAVDPDRDRASLKDYVVQFHPDFIGVTGAIEQIERALKGIDAAATRGKPDARGNYQVTHSASVAVIDPQGRLAAKINPPFDPAPTAQFLADLFRRRSDGRGSETGQ
jgi:protein SCO1